MIRDITLVLLHLENPIIILYLLCIYLVYELVESASFRFNFGWENVWCGIFKTNRY